MSGSPGRPVTHHRRPAPSASHPPRRHSASPSGKPLLRPDQSTSWRAPSVTGLSRNQQPVCQSASLHNQRSRAGPLGRVGGRQSAEARLRHLWCLGLSATRRRRRRRRRRRPVSISFARGPCTAPSSDPCPRPPSHAPHQQESQPPEGLCVGAGRRLRGTSLLSRRGHASPALTGIRARARPVRLLASSGDTGSLAAPWTAEKAQEGPSPPASLHPSVLPTASRPGVARVPGASHSGGPSASCSNGAHAHGASSDQGPAVGGERHWGRGGQ